MERLQYDSTGIDPEMVLVFTLKGNTADFSKVVKETGLTWLGSHELDDVEPDNDFYYMKNGQKNKTREVPVQAFLSMSNRASLNQILSLWKKYQAEEEMPYGLAAYLQIFGHLIDISLWGPKHRLEYGHFLEYVEDWYGGDGSQDLEFQIEFWFREKSEDRQSVEAQTTELIQRINGEVISTYQQADIKFHSLKAKAPLGEIQQMIDRFNNPSPSGKTFDLLHNPQIMLFASPGVFSVSGEGEPFADDETQNEAPSAAPKVALLDGVPLLNHVILNEALVFDDPEELRSQYTSVSEMKHGTAMASIILHGDLNDPNRKTISSKLYVQPVLVPDAQSLNREETLVPGRFPEDLLERALLRMFDPVNGTAPKVKVINLSLGLRDRPFDRQIGSWARLLDYLAYRFNVLFIVSAGNCGADLELGRVDDFNKLSALEKRKATLTYMHQERMQRRLLSPSESLNALTAGSSHQDACLDNQILASKRIDVLPLETGADNAFPSPINPMGGGFRRSIKPEVMLPGGRQYYEEGLGTGRGLRVSKVVREPGVKTAAPGKQGELNHYLYSSGTSNAAALATHGAAHLLDLIEEMNLEGAGIQDEHIPVLLKAMLVHSAVSPETAKKEFEKLIKEHSTKDVGYLCSHFFGYGISDYRRVLECTEKRATVLGVGTFDSNKFEHIYELPMPHFLDHYDKVRRLTLTLAWFSPINPLHSQYYRAKMSFELKNKKQAYKQKAEGLAKQLSNFPSHGPLFNSNQIKNATVQHQVFEGDKIFDVSPTEVLPIHIKMNKSNAGGVDFDIHTIPYALVASFEVGAGETQPVYEEIKKRLAEATKTPAARQQT